MLWHSVTKLLTKEYNNTLWIILAKVRGEPRDNIEESSKTLKKIQSVALNLIFRVTIDECLVKLAVPEQWLEPLIS